MSKHADTKLNQMSAAQQSKQNIAVMMNTNKKIGPLDKTSHTMSPWPGGINRQRKEQADWPLQQLKTLLWTRLGVLHQPAAPQISLLCSSIPTDLFDF